MRLTYSPTFQEMLKVWQFLTAEFPSEAEDDGVLLELTARTAVWSYQGEQLRWKAEFQRYDNLNFGDDDGGEYIAVVVPARAIEIAKVELAMDRLIEFEFADRMQTIVVTSEKFQTVITLPQREPNFFEIQFNDCSNSASLLVEDFRELIDRCHQQIVGVERRTPDPIISVGPNYIALQLDSKTSGGYQTTHKSFATTTGSASCRTDLNCLAPIFSQYGDDEGVTIFLPESPYGAMTIAGHSFWVEIWTRPAGALQNFPAVNDAVREFAEPEIVGNLDVIQFEYDNYLLEGVITESRPERFRITTTICSGVHKTVELLSELNDYSKNVVGVHVWCRDGEVCISSDVPIADIANLRTYVEELLLQADGIAPYFGAIAGEAV